MINQALLVEKELKAAEVELGEGAESELGEGAELLGDVVDGQGEVAHVPSGHSGH